MNIGLNSDNDIYVLDGTLPLVTGIEEIRQLTRQVLQAFEGEWFLDLDLGMPYFQTILQKATTLSAIEGIYIDTIIGIPGILDLESFTLLFNPATRTLDVRFRALTVDGLLDFTLDEGA